MTNGFCTFDARQLSVDLERFDESRIDEVARADVATFCARYLELIRHDTVEHYSRRALAGAAITLLDVGVYAEAVARLSLSLQDRVRRRDYGGPDLADLKAQLSTVMGR